MEKRVPMLPIWAAIGLAVGAGLGVAAHDIPRFVGFGLVFGVAFGGILDLLRRKRRTER